MMRWAILVHPLSHAAGRRQAGLGTPVPRTLTAIAEGREEAASAARARETAEAQAASSEKHRQEAKD